MYDFNNQGFGEATGHFTQYVDYDSCYPRRNQAHIPRITAWLRVVWKTTTEVGCALRDCNLKIFDGGAVSRAPAETVAVLRDDETDLWLETCVVVVLPGLRVQATW